MKNEGEERKEAGSQTAAHTQGIHPDALQASHVFGIVLFGKEEAASG